MFHRGDLSVKGETGSVKGETIKCEVLARESANLSPILARQWWRHFRLWWPFREGRDGKCEGGNDKCEFLAKESANLSPNCNFSATMVTSLPSHHFRLTTSVSLLPSHYFRLTTSVSLLPSLSLSHRLYLTHNIGSASALPIIQTERERDRRKWRHHCRAKIGDEFTLSLAKNSHFSFLPSHFPSLPSRKGHHGGAEIRNEFTLSIAKNFFALRLCSQMERAATSDRKPKTNDQILPSPILFFPSKNWIKLIPKTIGNRKRDCAWGGSGW